MSPEQRLSKALIQHHPELVARLLENYPVKDTALILLEFDQEHIAKVLEKLQPITGAEYCTHWPLGTVVSLLDLLDPQRALQLLRIMDEGKRNTVLDGLPEKSSEVLRRMLRYPKNTVGYFMDPRVMVLPEDITVKEAMKRIRKLKSDAFYFPYVVDLSGNLTGIITVRKLMQASPDQSLGSIMHPDVMRVSDKATTSEIKNLPGIATFQSLPVVNSEGRFLGVLKKEALGDFAQSRPESENFPLISSVGTVCEMYVHTLGSLLSTNERNKP